MITHQTPEQIFQAATPEQKILWNEIFLKFGERVAVSQLVLIQPAAATELSIYVSGKMFFAYSLELSMAGPGITAGGVFGLLYDEGNVLNHCLVRSNVVWDVTAAAVRYSADTFVGENQLFSRINFNGYGYVKFIGYRLTF